jgi:hypothetical protein
MVGGIGDSDRESAMDMYALGAVATTIDGARGEPLYGFKVIAVQGRPLVSLSFESAEEAEAAHKAMQPIIAKAKLITPHPPPYPR